MATMRRVKTTKVKSEQARTVDCSVTPGMFSNERGVVVQAMDGRKVFALVDIRHVLVDREPSLDAEVPGRVKITVVSLKKNSALIDLPQPALSEGPRVEVPKNALR